MVDPGIKHLEFQDLSEVRSSPERREDRESPGGRRRAQLQQAQYLESLGQLASGITQDFNNLLEVILSYASFVSAELADPSGPDSPARLKSVRRDLEQITLAAERAASVTCQPRAFVRQEVVHPQVPDLDHVATDVQEMLRRTLAEHVELVTTLAGDLWPVLADPAQQALLGAIMAGAADYVSKQTCEVDLVGAVRTVRSDPSTLDPCSSRQVIERLRDRMAGEDPMAALTTQEKRVLELLGHGLTNREIAQHMFLAEKTAKNYVSSLLAKLGMHRRAEAAAFAVRYGPDRDGLALARGGWAEWPGPSGCENRAVRLLSVTYWSLIVINELHEISRLTEVSHACDGKRPDRRERPASPRSWPAAAVRDCPARPFRCGHGGEGRRDHLPAGRVKGHGRKGSRTSGRC
jgi:DNA-binding NarL/FixJ family response regulator